MLVRLLPGHGCLHVCQYVLDEHKRLVVHFGRIALMYRKSCWQRAGLRKAVAPSEVRIQVVEHGFKDIFQPPEVLFFGAVILTDLYIRLLATFGVQGGSRPEDFGRFNACFCQGSLRPVWCWMGSKASAQYSKSHR